MTDPYDSHVHGPDVEMAAGQVPGGTDDPEDGSAAEAPPRRRSSIASGLGALVRPSREARFGLAALLSFLILVTVMIMKREKPQATAKGGRRTPPVARIHDTGPKPGDLALAPAASAPAEEVETPPVPPAAAESRAAEPPIGPAPTEAETVPAQVDPIQLAAAEEDDKTPPLPPDLAVDSSEVPGAKANDEPTPQPPSPADPIPATPPSSAPDASPAPAPSASTPLDVPEPSPPAESGPASSEGALPTPEPGAPAAVTPIPAPSSATDPDLSPAPALSPIVDLPNPAAPVAPPASGPPTPSPSPSLQSASPATATPASPDPAPSDPASSPDLPAPVDGQIPPTSSDAQDVPTLSEAKDAPASVDAPELPAPVDPQVPPTRPPARSPEPIPAPDVAPSAEPEAAPARAKDVPDFASPPRQYPPASGSTDNASGGSLVTIPNVGKRRLMGEDLERADPPADTTIERPKAPERDAVDRVESVPHVVQKGENFWTISRLSYGSGRFYKALWEANRQRVPVIDELYVGTTILIPPPEALDHSLIIPAKTARPARPAEPTAPVRRTSRSTLDAVPAEPKEIEIHLPAAPPSAGEVDPEPEVGARPRLPVYKIRAKETLRSIANRTLGDSHRADEILELNRTVIKDPNDLTTGQEIKLPEDARVGRRAR